MSIDSRLLPIVAITGGSIVVGCGGYSGSSCGSYGSFGSFGSSAVAGTGARARQARARQARGNSAPSSYAGCPVPNIGADGIYEGTLSTGGTQNPVVAIIADNGDGRMSGQDGTYYRLSVSTSGIYATGSFSGYSQKADFPNGRQTTSGSLTATLTNAGMSGTLADPAGNMSALSLSFDNVYTLASALPTLAGTWTSSANGFSLTATVRPDGTFSATDSNKCSYSGAFSLIDANFNAYSESYARTCGGSSLMFTGLASYFPANGSAAPYIRMLADDGAGDFVVADLK